MILKTLPFVHHSLENEVYRFFIHIYEPFFGFEVFKVRKRRLSRRMFHYIIFAPKTILVPSYLDSRMIKRLNHNFVDIYCDFHFYQSYY